MGLRVKKCPQCHGEKFLNVSYSLGNSDGFLGVEKVVCDLCEGKGVLIESSK